jgi:hypothetical protein
MRCKKKKKKKKKYYSICNIFCSLIKTDDKKINKEREQDQGAVEYFNMSKGATSENHKSANDASLYANVSCSSMR